MIPFFPITGLILGIMVSGFDLIALKLWPQSVVSLLDVIFLIIITGALHVDGLGDTSDGLFSHKSRENALEIMKDSRIGTMGLVTILCMLGIKFGGINSIHQHRCLALIIIPAYARSSMLFGIKFLKYGRPDGGTGHSFFKEPLVPKDFWALSIPLTLSFFMGLNGILLNLIFISLTLVIINFYHKKLGCITGDMLGAMTETTEAILFLTAAISI